jgi:hypothetical protein
MVAPAMTEEANLIGPDEVGFRLELTPPQLRIVYAALKSYYDDFGHEESDLRDQIRGVLAKFPEPGSLR